MDREIRLKWLATAATDIGIELDNCAREFLAKDHSLTEDNLLYHNYLQLFMDWEKQLSDSDLGLHLSETLNFKEMGTYGALLESAQSIAELFELIVNYEALMGAFSIINFIPGMTTSRLEYKVKAISPYPVTHDLTLTVGFYVKLIRIFVGHSWKPISVGFEFSQPEDTSEYKRLFGANLYFDQATNFIEIQNKILPLEVNSSRQELLAILKKHADTILASRGEKISVNEKVKAIMHSEIPSRKITIGLVAQQLNISRSQLQRNLASEGTTFRQLRDEVLYSLAIHSLTETKASCLDIALTLGYSETSAFNHAFTRLSNGMTPLQFRKQSQKNKGM